jgi:hypothetical protein
VSAVSSSEVGLQTWPRHLKSEMENRGHVVEVRRSRSGSPLWRIDGGRWVYAGPAYRKMEIAIYGRPNP